MNWLAHLYLSNPTIEFRLGNLLADTVKNQRWEGMGDDFISGFECHRKIDTFTDRHTVIRRSKSRLKGSSSLKGVVIDVFFDHLLTRYWGQYSDELLEDYLNAFYQEASHACLNYPEEYRQFVESLRESNRLGRYGEMEGVKAALNRIDGRLSDRALSRGCLGDFMPSLTEQYENLELDFGEFFPELVEYIKS